MPIPAGNVFPALPAIQPAVTGTTPTPVAVGSSLRTVNGNLVAYGATLELKNASGGAVDVTIIDPGRTAAGNPADQTPEQVAAGTTEYFKLADQHIDRTMNLVYVAVQPTAGVTAQVIY